MVCQLVTPVTIQIIKDITQLSLNLCTKLSVEDNLKLKNILQRGCLASPDCPSLRERLIKFVLKIFFSFSPSPFLK